MLHRSLSVTKKEINEYNPPRYAITNGFAIRNIPLVISVVAKNGKLYTSINAERDLDDLMCAAISPVRPFGYMFMPIQLGVRNQLKVISLFLALISPCWWSKYCVEELPLNRRL